MEQRIQLVLKHYNMSAAQLADNIGVQRSSISHILSGRNKPSYDFLQRLTAMFPDLDANWLLSGIGAIEKASKTQEKRVIEQDLFNQSLPFEKNENLQLKTSKIVDETSEKKQFSEVKYVNSPVITNVNSVKQIIFVYENNTFEILNPK